MKYEILNGVNIDEDTNLISKEIEGQGYKIGRGLYEYRVTDSIVDLNKDYRIISVIHPTDVHSRAIFGLKKLHNHIGTFYITPDKITLAIFGREYLEECNMILSRFKSIKRNKIKVVLGQSESSREYYGWYDDL